MRAGAALVAPLSWHQLPGCNTLIYTWQQLQYPPCRRLSRVETLAATSVLRAPILAWALLRCRAQDLAELHRMQKAQREKDGQCWGVVLERMVGAEVQMFRP